MFKYIRKWLKNQKGFTLVELMVVVVIIGILVGIAVPSYNKVTKTAEKTACEANMRAVMGAIQVIKFENINSETPDELGGPLNENHPLMVKKYFTELPTCPAGGNYTIGIEADGTVTITCPNDHHVVDEE